MDNNENAMSSNELVNTSSNELMLERIIENIINNYVDNNQQTQPLHTEQNVPRQSNNQHYVENMSMIHALRDVLVGYNTNMREYQENIRNFLNIIHTTQFSENTQNQYFQQTQPLQREPEPQRPQPQPQPSRTARTTMYNIRQPANNRTSFTLRPLQTTPRNPVNNRPIVSENQQTRQTTQIPSIINNLLNTDTSILFSDRPIINRLGRGLFNNLRDVVVYPSQSQITNATRNIEFSDNSANMNSSCPITLDEFQNGDMVRQIIPCGHIFQETALRNWFTRNVRCPVCRYDIRDYVANDDISRNPINRTEINYNSDSDTEDDVDEIRDEIQDEIHDEYTRDSSVNRIEQNTPIASANNVNQIVNNILNTTTRTLDEILASYMRNYTDSSDNLIYRVEIPLYYDEYYDASDNYMGMGDLMPDYD